jgi:phosphoglycolate phosphatase-like HAD superfamily hydrolase
MSNSGQTVSEPAVAASTSRASSWRDADAFLFDIDGTILLSKDRTHRYALHRAMRDVFGVETTIDGIAYHGKTDLGILRAALERVGVSSADIDARMPAALDVCRRHCDENVHLFTPNVLPAVPQVLEQLHASGKLLAVASGNLESIGWIKLSAAGLRHYFQFGAYADEREFREDVFQDAAAEVRRRLGPQASVCFIGDTPEDIHAARKACGLIVAVGTGIFKSEELAALGPDVCVADCTELLER